MRKDKNIESIISNILCCDSEKDIIDYIVSNYVELSNNNNLFESIKKLTNKFKTDYFIQIMKEVNVEMLKMIDV